MTAPRQVIRAQPQQELALASTADVVIFGGGAGGGKSWGLLLSVVQNAGTPAFAAEVFRRTYPELTMTGGLWPESYRVFAHAGGAANQSALRWAFPSGAGAKFSHMQHAADRLNWKGAQLPFIGFDQLESFEEEQFWYLLSRNRDPSGTVRPYVFATCNPVPADDPVGGWVHRLVAWWIDPATGLAIPARSGRVRWAVRDGDVLTWGDDRAALERRYGAPPKSVTFIESKLEDNPALEAADPGYRARLMLLPLVERERLLGRNWNARPSAGRVFNRAWFPLVDAAPRAAARVRAWDKGGTEGGGDPSAGVRLALDAGAGVVYVEDVVRGQWSALGRNRVIRQVAEADGPEVDIWLEEEGGSGGKESAELSVRELAGYAARTERPTTNLLARVGALSAQAEAGNVRLVRGPWNEAFLAELHAFDGRGRGHDDQVAAGALAYAKLALQYGGPAPLVVTLGESGNGAPRRRVTLRDR